MMSRTRSLLLLLIAAATFGVSAPAWAFHLNLEGGVTKSTLKEADGGASHTPQNGMAGMAELSLPFIGSLSLDIGVQYLQRKYTTPGTSGDLSVTQTMIEVPVLFRLWLVNWLSIGAGGYYGKYQGNIKEGSSASPAIEKGYSAAGQTMNDYGAVGSVSLDIPLGIVTGIVLDARYTLGLKNNFTGGSAKFNDVQGFAGLRFGFK